MQVPAHDLDLCEAMVERYADHSEFGEARQKAEMQYAKDLEQIGKQYGDPHVLAMAAEALMNLHMWDYYQAMSLCVVATVALNCYGLTCLDSTGQLQPTRVLLRPSCGSQLCNLCLQYYMV